MLDKSFWMDIRQALLMIVDTIERMLGITPRTSECRKDVNQK
jgi:hypothetical protein